MSSSSNEYLVFISHAGEDTWVARQIAREIAATGAQFFLDEADIKIGDDFAEVIRNALNSANELVVLITPWALERSFVISEIGVAWGRGIPIVIVLQGLSISEFVARPEAILLKKRDMIKLNDIDQYFPQLGARVRSEKQNE
jgi:hypothetical protein